MTKTPIAMTVPVMIFASFVAGERKTDSGCETIATQLTRLNEHGE